MQTSRCLERAPRLGAANDAGVSTVVVHVNTWVSVQEMPKFDHAVDSLAPLRTIYIYIYIFLNFRLPVARL